MLKRAGFAKIEFQLLAAHNEIVGDTAFLKAEGSGIPAQLVKSGYLQAEALDRIADQWRAMLGHPDHAVLRLLCAGIGEKPGNDSAPELSSVPQTFKDAGSNGAAPADEQELESIEGLRQFIQETLAAQMEAKPESLPLPGSLIHLGVDSLAATALCSRLKSRLLVSLPVAEVLGGKSIVELADQVMSLTKTISEQEKQTNRRISARPRSSAPGERAWL